MHSEFHVKPFTTGKNPGISRKKLCKKCQKYSTVLSIISSAIGETHVLVGMSLFAEILNGIAVVSISSNP